jgi:hypothetical protein
MRCMPIKFRLLEAYIHQFQWKKASVEDYWLSEEMSSLPDMFCGMNENFATAAIEGALVLAGDSVDLEAVWVAASEGIADVMPAGSGVQK